jgi:hypothetical protein
MYRRKAPDLVVDERTRSRIWRANDDELARSLKVPTDSLIVFRAGEIFFVPEYIETTPRHSKPFRGRITPQRTLKQYGERSILARVAYESIMKI